MIQNPNLNFSYRDIVSLKDASPNSHFFPTENQSKNLDNRFDQNRPTCGSLEKWTITWVIEVQFG